MAEAGGLLRPTSAEHGAPGESEERRERVGSAPPEGGW
jgi:hypothetical protein